MATFQPLICRCGFGNGIDHVVKSAAEWQRHKNKHEIEQAEELFRAESPPELPSLPRVVSEIPPLSPPIRPNYLQSMSSEFMEVMEQAEELLRAESPVLPSLPHVVVLEVPPLSLAPQPNYLQSMSSEVMEMMEQAEELLRAESPPVLPSFPGTVVSDSPLLQEGLLSSPHAVRPDDESSSPPIQEEPSLRSPSPGIAINEQESHSTHTAELLDFPDMPEDIDFSDVLSISGQMNQGYLSDRQQGDLSDGSEPDGGLILHLSDSDSDCLSYLSADGEHLLPATPITDSANNEADDLDDDDRRPYQLNRRELISLALHDMSIKFKGARAYVHAQRDLLAATGGHNRPLDYRTVRNRISAMTEVMEKRYDCCVNGCMSYAMYPEASMCLETSCRHPRWKPESRIPYRQHSYIPLLARLKLWWSDFHRSRQLTEYRKIAEGDRQREKRSDFWSGDLFHDMRRKGLFEADTDMAFTLSTDGVKVRT